MGANEEPLFIAYPDHSQLLELAFFALATWALIDSGNTSLAWILGGAVLLHYTVSYDRIAWLLKQ